MRPIAVEATPIAVEVTGGGGGWLWGRGGPTRTHTVTVLSLGLSDSTCLLNPKGILRCAGARLDHEGNAAVPEGLLVQGAVVGARKP